MPQLAALMVVGAGMYAGLKWISREIARQTVAARQAAAEAERHAASTRRGPKDLGQLEWDEQAQVYRPLRG